jgi:hypothetical protein
MLPFMIVQQADRQAGGLMADVNTIMIAPHLLKVGVGGATNALPSTSAAPPRNPLAR